MSGWNILEGRAGRARGLGRACPAPTRVGVGAGAAGQALGELSSGEMLLQLRHDRLARPVGQIEGDLFLSGQ